jgi:hypothetical protein
MVGVGSLGGLTLVLGAALERVVDVDRLEHQNLVLDVDLALSL